MVTKTFPQINSIDTHFREYPNRFTRTTQVILQTGVDRYPLPQDNFLRKKPIIGLLIRVSETDERRTITNNIIAAKAVMRNCFLTLTIVDKVMPFRIPLEYFLFQYNVSSGVNAYRQMSLPPGIVMENCTLELNSVAVAALNNNDAVEFTWVYLDDEAPNCQPV